MPPRLARRRPGPAEVSRVGAVVTWQRGYRNPSILRAFGSAVLAVVLRFPVLLGGDLHLH